MTADYRTPSPDEGHEALRAPLAAAIDELRAAVAAISAGDEDRKAIRDELGKVKVDNVGKDLAARVTALEKAVAALQATVKDPPL